MLMTSAAIVAFVAPRKLLIITIAFLRSAGVGAAPACRALLTSRCNAARSSSLASATGLPLYGNESSPWASILCNSSGVSNLVIGKSASIVIPVGSNPFDRTSLASLSVNGLGLCFTDRVGRFMAIASTGPICEDCCPSGKLSITSVGSIPCERYQSASATVGGLQKTFVLVECVTFDGSIPCERRYSVSCDVKCR